MRIPAVVFLLLAALGASWGQGGDPPKPAVADAARWGSGVAARVNRDIITTAEVWKSLQGALAGLSPDKRQELYERKLVTLIATAVVNQAAERTQMTVSSAALNSFIEDRKEEMGGEQAFQEFLMESGVTEQEYVTDVTKESQRHLYLRTQAGARGALGPELRPEFAVEPTVAEIRAYYRKNLESEFTHGAEAKVLAMALTRIHFRLDMEKLLAKVEEIRESLRTGADFQTLARRHSRLEEESGGDLGWISKEADWAAPIVEYAFEGAVGAVSEPLKYRAGYFLVLVEDRREARVVPFSEAQVEIRDKLRSKKVRRAESEIQRRLLEESYIWPPVYKERLLKALNRS